MSYGLSNKNNSKLRPVEFNLGHYYLKKEILDKYDHVDVFVHTWNPEQESIIIEYYNPKLAIYEPQNREKVLNDNKYPNKYPICSNYYSYKQVDLLRQQYESEHDFKYDCVISSRFDIILDIKKGFEKYDMTKFHLVDVKKKFREEKKTQTAHEIYVGKKWMIDYFFFSNGENMSILCSLWDHLPEYKTTHNTHGILAKYILSTPLHDRLQFLDADEFYAYFLHPTRTYQAVTNDPSLKMYVNHDVIPFIKKPKRNKKK